MNGKVTAETDERFQHKSRLSTVGSGADSEWSLVPIVLLRHAGFPMSLLGQLADRSAAREMDAVLARHETARNLAQQVKIILRSGGTGKDGDIASGVGMLRPLQPDDLARLGSCLTLSALDVITRYQDAALILERSWAGFERNHAARISVARNAVVRLFKEDALQQVLLLSNDARFKEFAAWIDQSSTGSDGHFRRMTDLLTMYLQRVTTKNETHSHFGPLSVARVTPDATGISWGTGSLRRVSFLSHWAGETLAETFSHRPSAFELVRPRRRPLAFVEDRRIQVYAFQTRTGMPDDWRFDPIAGGTLDDEQLWVWERCNGENTVAELRTAWAECAHRVSGRSLEEVLRDLMDRNWLIGRWEIPIGSAYPLQVLTEHLRQTPGGSDDQATVKHLAGMLRDFAAKPAKYRAPLLTELKDTFEAVTGTAANRSQGRHYADRSVFYEEAYSPVRDMTIGQHIADFIGQDLSLVYDLTLLTPRLRIRREQEILRRWTEERFGTGVPIPIQHFYSSFFADKKSLDEKCSEVDQEIADIDREITAILLDGATDGQHEKIIEREHLEEFLARYPAAPPALCNPDVMLAAPDADALARGDFLAVVGDCHAVREVLTHSSFATLIAPVAPDLLHEVYSRYQCLLDDDEVLVDLARAHPDKTAAQLTYPCFDLEVYGLSPKSRDKVLQPQQLYVLADAGRLELRARGSEGRLKLLAPLGGGPSIRQDPLSIFAFPRHFGGIGLRAAERDHLPRIRCGAVVLRRESWRISADAFRGWSPGSLRAKGDAAEFATAHRLRQELGLPRYGFAKIAGEPKPVFVDWDSPLIIRQLFRVCRRSDSSVEFSEMLPDHENLWLDINGQRHTSELRCAVFSPRKT